MGWPYDILEAKPHGRLLAYDPISKTTRIVLDDLYFANGLALSAEEDYLLIAETPRYRILRLWLKGPLANTVEPFADNLPLLPDNLFMDQEGEVWVGGSKRIAVIDTLQPRPYWKKQLAKLPYAFLKRVPTMNRYGLAVRLSAEGQVKETLHDPQGNVYGVSSVVRQANALYFGTLFGDSIARLELE
jgi:sugar lactone lactonase YvrE